ncbi:dipeptide/oligopeptide/nickel ABC transporter permease/ATP-binding protein [Brachybacterium sacelli]|uniref:ABC-type dipeptide/oligopeptide/nickel transport system ATPase component/ABC-type dipeptide/oligopeptide/nickel transport system permease subunit n=1 Tax=Brachybacterium sacelli TaxID=173364 RepID=A0ABS4WX15_9MICO|nr:dipeptide/oligopeptide/nickel ABC transporter permease/ATP-binding protein [Brachybacterium sacelli]MBP2380513.1 ABC-type dipeptide/oligopeptide/nickel transport system ATPase component/ABC-type dipeptide/oligopeptide/nickel transport system permease subunit [Brachybacterium sacelli]
MRVSSVLPRSGKVRAGLIIVIVFVVIAAVGPLVATRDPQATSFDMLQAPSGQYWLGTTQSGQDVFAQFVHGARVSLLVGLLAGVISQLFSVVIGLLGGYLRGIADDLLYILTAVFLVIPGLPLLVVLTGYLPSRGLVSIAVVIAITSWAGSARVIRAQTMSLRNREFVEAARATGESRTRLMFWEILPNMLPLVASGFLFSVIGGILAEAGLAFLGLGSLTTISWGSMLYFAQNSQSLLSGAWWWYVPPGLAIAVIGAGLALINFGIDEYSNPRLRTGAAVAGRPAGSKAAGADPTSTNVRTTGTGSATAPRPGGASATTAEIVAATGAAETDEDLEPRIRPSVMSGSPIIEVDGLHVEYPTAYGTVHAVEDVSLTLRRGEILGLAGESGSGKSTLTNAITRLLRPPAKVVGGSITYRGGEGNGTDLLNLEERELRALRWNEIAVVFQSAMNALNPVTTIRSQFDDVIRVHRPGLASSHRTAVAEEHLARVGIDPGRIDAYPHELSGGMKQRVAIAIALVLEPDVIFMDEPTTALDLLVQRDVLDQIVRLREEYGFAIVFTTHDLALLLEISDSIAVMRHGHVVEYGPALDIYRDAQHPYTRELLSSLADLGSIA